MNTKKPKNHASKAAIQRLGARAAHANRQLVDRYNLQRALQVKLLEIAVRSLTARSLAELEIMARLAREMLVAGQDPRALGKRHGQAWVSNLQGGGEDNITAEMSDPYPYGQMALGGAPLSSSSYAENFGATALRELLELKAKENAHLAAAPKQESTLDLIADARKKGLTDVADRLEAKLLGESAPTPAKPRKPAKPALVARAKRTATSKKLGAMNGAAS